MFLLSPPQYNNQFPLHQINLKTSKFFKTNFAEIKVNAAAIRAVDQDSANLCVVFQSNIAQIIKQLDQILRCALPFPSNNCNIKRSTNPKTENSNLDQNLENLHPKLRGLYKSNETHYSNLKPHQ